MIEGEDYFVVDLPEQIKQEKIEGFYNHQLLKEINPRLRVFTKKGREKWKIMTQGKQDVLGQYEMNVKF